MLNYKLFHTISCSLLQKLDCRNFEFIFTSSFYFLRAHTCLPWKITNIKRINIHIVKVQNLLLHICCLRTLHFDNFQFKIINQLLIIFYFLITYKVKSSSRNLKPIK